jgi:hypothetical protein
MSVVPRRSVAVLVAAAAWAGWVGAHAFAPDGFSALDLLDDGTIEPGRYVWTAARRAAWGGFGALLVWAAIWQTGRWLTTAADSLFADTHERLQVALAVGAAGVSCLFVAASQLRLYRPAVVAALTVALAVSRPRAWAGAVAAIRAALRTARRSRLVAARADAAYAACAAVAVAWAGIAALAPEVEYDALWYHLWLPARALAAGAPVDIVEEYVSLYPLGWELLNGAALTLGDPVAAKLLHFVCLPLVAGATCLAARDLAPRVSRPLLVALVVCTPTLLWEASTAYVDLALAWLVTVGAVALLRYRRTSDRRWLLVAGVVMGGALGVKHLALVVLAIGVVAVALGGSRHRSPGTDAAPRVTVNVRAAALFGAVALVIALPWYARAWAASGNPVFPELYDVFGGGPPERWTAETAEQLTAFKARFGTTRDVGSLVLLPWNVTVHAARFGGSLGPLFLVLLPFSLLGRWPRAALAVAAGCFAYAAVWASPFGSFQLRFVLPLVPFMAVGAAAGAGGLLRHARQSAVPAWAVHAPVIVLLTLNLPFFTVWQEPDRKGWSGWLTHVPRGLPLGVVAGAESEEAYLTRRVPTYRAWQYLAVHVAPGSRVLTFSGGDHYYSRTWRLWSDAAIARPVTWDAQVGHEAQLRDDVAALRISHVLVERRALEQPALSGLPLWSDRLRTCCLRPAYEDNAALVFRFETTPPPTLDQVSRR